MRWQICRAMLLAALAFAATPWASAQQVPLQDKPFAEHKIVLQLSDGDARKHALVLSVANNLLKAYDPDKVAIEVVAFGPGIDLLSTGSERPQAGRKPDRTGRALRYLPQHGRHDRAGERKTAGVHSGGDAGAGGRRADPVPGGEWVHGGAAVGRQGRVTPGVIPRESGESSTPRPFRIALPPLEYWIARLRGR
ncbi:hypothetical protein ABIF78_005660 [Bradyrhizobium japonicum]